MTVTRPALRRRSERGAVTALVAVVVGGGVLMSVSALVVDVGRLYGEREQLQSGADAAAMALAQRCATAPATCATDSASVVAGYVDANSHDNTSSASTICGRGVNLPTCPSAGDNLTACVGPAPETGSYVEVHTATRLPDGSTLLPPTFAQGVLDGPGNAGHRVGACARAAWGPPSAGAGAALTFSECEFDMATNGGTSFQPAPGEGTPSAAGQVVLRIHDTGGNPDCPAGPSGWDRPGGFGWLDETGGPCQAAVSVDSIYGGNPGVPASQACQTLMPGWRTNRTVLLMPVYESVRGTGSLIEYRLSGLASFVLTGYYLSGFKAESWLTDDHPCSGNDRCVYGYFVRTLLTTTGRIGGRDLGASIVTLVG